MTIAASSGYTQSHLARVLLRVEITHPMEFAEQPVPLALLVANQVYQDRATGNFIIAGTFNTIACLQLPARQDFSVFFQFTNVSKPVDIIMRIEHEGDGDKIIEARGPITANSPLDVVAANLNIRGMPLNHTGKYWIQLLGADEEILIQAPLMVHLMDRLPTAPKDDMP